MESATVIFTLRPIEPYYEIYADDFANSDATKIDLSQTSAIYEFKRYTNTLVDNQVVTVENNYYEGDVFKDIDMYNQDVTLWMDPISMMSMADTILQYFVKTYPDNAYIFEENYKPCVFEYIYFSRPDSIVFHKNVYVVRKKLGKQLALEHSIKADIVMPIPDSGLAAAIGYSEQSKISFELGLIRNHYVGRTFIEPTQELRELKVKLKLNPIKEVIENKRIVVIDDSLVRGTTSKAIVELLKKAGAKEVYLLISAPPTIASCFYGVDTPSKDELIAANKSIEECGHRSNCNYSYNCHI